MQLSNVVVVPLPPINSTKEYVTQTKTDVIAFAGEST